MTNADSTSDDTTQPAADDYTTQPPAVFDETASAEAPTTPLRDRELVGAGAPASSPTTAYPTVAYPASADAGPRASGTANLGSPNPGSTNSGYGQDGYAHAGFSAPAPTAAAATVYPPVRRTSTLAVLTLVFGILGFGVVPIITGHIALSQLKRSGEEGRGLALAGLILGYVTIAGWVFAALAWFGIAGAALMAHFFSVIAH